MAQIRAVTGAPLPRRAGLQAFPPWPLRIPRYRKGADFYTERMTMIVSRTAVRAAVAHALLESKGDTDAAILAASQALGMPVEAVRDCMEQEAA